jgi:hypothetical protein
LQNRLAPPSTSQQAAATNQIPQGYPVQRPSVNTVSTGNTVGTVKSQVCNLTKSSQRTVKMFHTFIHGKSGKIKGFVIEDSAAEITLVKKELTDSLGIYGERCLLDLSWTYAAIKRTEAFKLNLRISSIVAGDDAYD